MSGIVRSRLHGIEICPPGSFRKSQKGKVAGVHQPAVVALRERIVFVIVALRAGHRLREPVRRRRARALAMSCPFAGLGSRSPASCSTAFSARTTP